MPLIPFATHFLAGSLLTLALPLGTLIVITVWYVLALRHVPEDTPVSSAALPSSEMLAAAAEAAPDPAPDPTPDSDAPPPPASPS
jgi:hypothetical protein